MDDDSLLRDSNSSQHSYPLHHLRYRQPLPNQSWSQVLEELVKRISQLSNHAFLHYNSGRAVASAPLASTLGSVALSLAKSTLCSKDNSDLVDLLNNLYCESVIESINPAMCSK